MSFSHGSVARFYYHTLDMSQYAESVDYAVRRTLAEYKPFGAAVQRVAGHLDASISLTGGALDAAPGANDEAAWMRIGEDTARPWVLLPVGDALGRVAYCGLSRGDNQRRMAGDDVIRLPVAIVNTDYPDRGVVLRALASGGVSPGGSYDGTAATNNGGCAYLICTSLTGGGAELIVKIQHSANNVDWSDLVTMTTLNAAGSEAKVVAAGTDVYRYLRVSWSLTGTATWFAAFCRR